MLETYRGIPYLLDSWLLLTGLALPVALLAAVRVSRPGTRLAALLLPAPFTLILAATLSPAAQPGLISTCGTSLTANGALTTVQGLLNVLLFVPAAALLCLATGRPALALSAGVALSIAVEAVQALIPPLGRSCQLHDVIANTLGAIVGVALAAACRSRGYGGYKRPIAAYEGAYPRGERPARVVVW